MSGSGWKKPDEVMKQMREKKRALQARFKHTTPIASVIRSEEVPSNISIDADQSSLPIAVKRRNPFRYFIYLILNLEKVFKMPHFHHQTISSKATKAFSCNSRRSTKVSIQQQLIQQNKFL